MDMEKFRKYKWRSVEIPEIDLKQYISSVKEIVYDYDEYHNYLDPENIIQYARSGLQKILDVDPTIFTLEELREIYEADKTLLENIDNALKWLYKSYQIEPNEYPESHWWWYLDSIKYGHMPKPDLDKIFEEYFKKVRESSGQ